MHGLFLLVYIFGCATESYTKEIILMHQLFSKTLAQISKFRFGAFLFPQNFSSKLHFVLSIFCHLILPVVSSQSILKRSSSTLISTDKDSSKGLCFSFLCFVRALVEGKKLLHNLHL